MSDVERTAAGLQIVIPGCERRTLPRSTTRVDEIGQRAMHFYRQPTSREELERRVDMAGHARVNRAQIGTWGGPALRSPTRSRPAHQSPRVR
jgi:hypothetical protein